MSQLPTCPRCGAYVQPDWPSCKICGYHPDDPLTHGPLPVPAAPRRRRNVLEVVYGVVVLVVLVALCVGAVRIGAYAWQHRNGSVDRQVFVVVPKS